MSTIMKQKTSKVKKSTYRPSSTLSKIDQRDLDIVRSQLEKEHREIKQKLKNVQVPQSQLMNAPIKDMIQQNYKQMGKFNRIINKGSVTQRGASKSPIQTITRKTRSPSIKKVKELGKVTMEIIDITYGTGDGQFV